MIILRLAPVYDRDWSFNLYRRILAPLNILYVRFGSGLQRMSALARSNLVDFLYFLLHRPAQSAGVNIFNVCDMEAYEFNALIQVFRNSGIHPNRPVVSLPLPFIWLATRIGGGVFHGKRKWLHSCYDKLASSLVFDNEKMLKTGFKPRHSLQTIFASTRRIENWQGVHG